MPIGAGVVVVAIGLEIEGIAFIHVGGKVSSGPKASGDGGALPGLAACAVLEVVYHRVG